MDKKNLQSTLDMLGVEFKGSFGKDKLLTLLAGVVDYSDDDLRAACKSRGIDAGFRRESMLDALGVEASIDDDTGDVIIGLSAPAAVEFEGDDVEVLCMVENVHLGNGEVMRRGERLRLPSQLVDLMEAKEQVQRV